MITLKRTQKEKEKEEKCSGEEEGKIVQGEGGGGGLAVEGVEGGGSGGQEMQTLNLLRGGKEFVSLTLASNAQLLEVEALQV
jgi:hypothetical protein